MNSNNTIGINEQKLELLATKIFEYVDQTNKVFNQIQNLIDESTNYFISEEGTIFRNKLKQQASYYYTVNQNLLSYASDFIKLKSVYKSKMIGISDMITSQKGKIGG